MKAYMKPNNKWIPIAALLFLLLSGHFIYNHSIGNEGGYPFDTNFRHGEIAEMLVDYQNKIPDERLYLHFDKPMYEPGDMIWFTAYIRDSRHLQPSAMSDIVHVELLDPRGQSVEKIRIVTDDTSGIARGDFLLDKDAKGGQYTVKAYTSWLLNDEEPVKIKRNIQVQDAVVPDIRMDVNFDRESYAPGQRVSAEISLYSADNKPLVEHPYVAVVGIDGVQHSKSEETTNQIGTGEISFRLPRNLNTTDVFINFNTTYRDYTEQIGRNVPVNLNNLKIEFFPEGGDLIAGINKKLALAAINEHGQPADFRGSLYGPEGKIKSLKSYYQGRGAVQFKPEYGHDYYVILNDPPNFTDKDLSEMSGMERIREILPFVKNHKKFSLPEVLPQDYGLSVTGKTEDHIFTSIFLPHPGAFTVLLQIGGEPYYEYFLHGDAGEQKLAIPKSELPMGVARITLFDGQNKPRAERAIFVNRHKGLNIEVSTDKMHYQPGEKVTVDIQTTDHNGNPAPSNISASVVSDPLLSFADDRQGGILPALFLEKEIGSLPPDPDFFFRNDEEGAEKALDHLMLTSGWSRFNREKMLKDKYPTTKNNPERKHIKGTVVDAKGNTLPVDYYDLYIDDIPIDQSENASFDFYDHDHLLLQNEKIEISAKLSENFIKKHPLLEQIADTSYIVHRYSDKLRFRYNGFFLMEDSLVYIGDNKSHYTIVDIATNANRQVEEATQFSGQVLDRETDEALPFANVILERNGRQVTGAETNIDGEFRFSGLEPGTYSVIFSYMGYDQVRFENIQIRFSANERMIIHLNPNNIQVGEFDIVERRRPLIEVHERPETTIAREEVANNSISSRSKQPVSVDKSDEPASVRKDTIIISPVRDILEEDRRKRNKRYLLAREFPADLYGKQQSGEERSDFRTTIHWEGHIKTGKNGSGQFTFHTSDDLSTFRISVAGLGQKSDGNYIAGEGDATFHTEIPLQLDARIPPVMMSGDQPDIPVRITNNSEQPIAGYLVVNIPEVLAQRSGFNTYLHIEPGATQTGYLSLTCPEFPVKKEFPITIAFNGESSLEHVRKEASGSPDNVKSGIQSEAVEKVSAKVSDRLRKEITILPHGFPVSYSMSERESDYMHTLSAENVVAGSRYGSLDVSSSVMDQLTGSMGSMMRKPTGCFEQTTSRNYPNILALQIMRENNEVTDEAEKKYLSFLEHGYNRLLGFENANGAYGSFRNDGNEVLTAFAILQYHEMSKVYDGVSRRKLNRSAKWLMSRLDSDNRFNLNTSRSRWRDSDEGKLMADAYILYALTSAGYSDKLEDVVSNIARLTSNSNDPYTIGLMAHALYESGNEIDANMMVKRLVELQNDNGSWCAEHHTMSGSRGVSACVETTSLAVRAMLKSGNAGNYGAIQAGMDFIMSSRRSSGYFGSTQGTIKGLKAINEYVRNFGSFQDDFRVKLAVNDTYLYEDLPMSAFEGNETVLLDGKYFSSSNDHVKVSFNQSESIPPYTLTIHEQSTLPPTHKLAPVGISVSVDNESPSVGETVRLTAVLSNKTNSYLSMSMAHVGIPAGMQVQHTQLNNMVEQEQMDFYEIDGSTLILYFEQMEPGEEKSLTFNLRSEIPGRFTAPATKGYMYYMEEKPAWSRGVEVQIRE